MSCPVCREARAAVKLVKDGTPILQCPACALAWWTPEEGFDPKDTYDASYFEGASSDRGYDDYGRLESSLLRTFRRRLQSLPESDRQGKLLDVGAAYSFAMRAAREMGWAACGIEVSHAAVRAAQRAGETRMAVASAEAIPFPDQSFQVATLWDVLEHIPDPTAAISDIARVLAPGGRLILTTGDVESWLARVSGPRWHLYTLPEHLYFFSRRSLEILLERNGFQIDQMTTEASFYTLGYLAERMRKTVLGQKQTAPANWPGSKFEIPVNLYDIVRVTATRKPA